MSGINLINLHSKNNPLIFINLLVFHLEISGIDVNDEHLPNIFFI